tara:strand:- start:40 stop:204 length:165 start_codon:yes stop_codon:yes gene_type:complete
MRKTVNSGRPLIERLGAMSIVTHSRATYNQARPRVAMTKKLEYGFGGINPAIDK